MASSVDGKDAARHGVVTRLVEQLNSSGHERGILLRIDSAALGLALALRLAWHAIRLDGYSTHEVPMYRRGVRRSRRMARGRYRLPRLPRHGAVHRQVLQLAEDVRGRSAPIAVPSSGLRRQHQQRQRRLGQRRLASSGMTSATTPSSISASSRRSRSTSAKSSSCGVRRQMRSSRPRHQCRRRHHSPVSRISRRFRYPRRWTRHPHHHRRSRQPRRQRS